MFNCEIIRFGVLKGFFLLFSPVVHVLLFVEAFVDIFLSDLNSSYLNPHKSLLEIEPRNLEILVLQKKLQKAETG